MSYSGRGHQPHAPERDANFRAGNKIRMMIASTETAVASCRSEWNSIQFNQQEYLVQVDGPEYLLD